MCYPLAHFLFNIDCDVDIAQLCFCEDSQTFLQLQDNVLSFDVCFFAIEEGRKWPSGTEINSRPKAFLSALIV